MQTRIENEKLIISLERRIDGTNASEFEQSLFYVINANDNIMPILDAEDLIYISSAGLRVLMKLRKHLSKSVVIQNVSPEVYEIFLTTGFTELLDVHKKLREISIEGCEQIGAGVSSKVYRIDRDSIVKVFHPGIGLERIEEERENSRTAFINGLPTAITFDIVKVGDCFGTVYELIDAVALSKFLRDNPDKAPEYRVKYAKLLKEMHKIRLSNNFSDIKAMHEKWVDNLGTWYSEDELSAMHRLIHAIPDRDTFVHCDAHIGNILVQDGELILIDMADVGRGHPVFDIGMLYYHYQMVPKSPGREFGLKTLLGFVPDTDAFLDELWNDFINVYFEPKSEKEYMMANAIVRVAGGIQALVTPVRQPQIDEKYKQMNVAGIRAHFLSKIEEQTELIKQMGAFFGADA